MKENFVTNLTTKFVKTNMRIFIFGGSGRIGYRFFKNFQSEGHELVATYFESNFLESNETWKNLDISNREMVLETVSKFKPDIVIHSSALTNVDLCETNHDIANSINIEGTKNIVEACKKIRSKIIFISTAYVFDGKKTIFCENDDCFPATYYGKTKLLGEEIIKSSGLSYLILRTDQPYGWKEKWQKTNSVTRVLDNFENNQEVREIIDLYNNPTFIEDIVEVTRILLDHNLEGIYHIVGPDFINRYEWAQLIAEVFNKEKNLIKPFESKELNLPAKRVNINLSNKKLFLDTEFRMKSVKEGLEVMLSNINKKT